MPLADSLLPKNAGRPKNLADFDARPDLAYLVRRWSSPEQTVWSPSWWINIVCLVVTLTVTLLIEFLPWNLAEFYDSVVGFPLWKQALIWSGTLLAVLLIFLLALAAIARSRMVIDRKRAEVRFDYGLFLRPSHTIRFIDIRKLGDRRVENNAGLDEPGSDVRVVYAELYSGDLVLLAVDPDWREKSLYRELQDAVENCWFQRQPNQLLLAAN